MPKGIFDAYNVGNFNATLARFKRSKYATKYKIEFNFNATLARFKLEAMEDKPPFSCENFNATLARFKHGVKAIVYEKNAVFQCYFSTI